MIDMTDTIETKSDQLNFVDLVEPKTITITGVKKVAGEQPISINYEGDNGKPWKPCKNMRRVMVQLWGKDADKYAGQKLTLYNDPSVKWAGKDLGGIRISHMTGIEKKFSVMLAVSKGNFKPFVVEPIIDKPLNPLSDDAYEQFCTDMKSANNMAALQDIGKRIKDGFFDNYGSDKLRKQYEIACDCIRSESN